VWGSKFSTKFAPKGGGSAEFPLGRIAELCGLLTAWFVVQPFPLEPLSLIAAKSNLEHPAIGKEHSEQARAPHTNEPRDVPRFAGLGL
jgi:hypothetical protein